MDSDRFNTVRRHNVSPDLRPNVPVLAPRKLDPGPYHRSTDRPTSTSDMLIAAYYRAHIEKDSRKCSTLNAEPQML